MRVITWLALRSILHIKDFLLRKGSQQHQGCFLYEASYESINHIFLHCHFVKRIWSLLRAGLGIKGILQLFYLCGHAGERKISYGYQKDMGSNHPCHAMGGLEEKKQWRFSQKKDLVAICHLSSIENLQFMAQLFVQERIPSPMLLS